MKIDIPLYLRSDRVSLDKESPTPGRIKLVEFKPADELPFKSKEGKYELTIEIEGTDFVLTANKTSMRNIAAKYGQESDKWIGKEVVMWSVKQVVGKEERDVIYVAPAVA